MLRLIVAESINKRRDKTEGIYFNFIGFERCRNGGQDYGLCIANGSNTTYGGALLSSKATWGGGNVAVVLK